MQRYEKPVFFKIFEADIRLKDIFWAPDAMQPCVEQKVERLLKYIAGGVLSQQDCYPKPIKLQSAACVLRNSNVGIKLKQQNLARIFLPTCIMGAYKRILLVEDDKDDQVFFVGTVTSLDNAVEVSVVDNGQQALHWLHLADPLPDLIVLDIRMPVLDGHSFLKSLKSLTAYARFKDIPVAVLTVSITDAEKCYALGASLYITKPSSVKLYRSILNTLLTFDLAVDSVLVRGIIANKVKTHPE